MGLVRLRSQCVVKPYYLTRLVSVSLVRLVVKRGRKTCHLRLRVRMSLIGLTGDSSRELFLHGLIRASQLRDFAQGV